MAIFAVDFDGTIVEGWRPDGEIYHPEIGPLRSGAREALLLMRERGHTIIIWTCRDGDEREKIAEYLRSAGVPFDYINEHHPELMHTFGNNTRKVWAHYYIDDRNITPWSWADIKRIVLELPGVVSS